MVEALRCRPLPASPETTAARPSEPAGARAAGRPPAGTVSWSLCRHRSPLVSSAPVSVSAAPPFLPGCVLLQSTRGWIPGRGQLGDPTGTGPRETPPDGRCPRPRPQSAAGGWTTGSWRCHLPCVSPLLSIRTPWVTACTAHTPPGSSGLRWLTGPSQPGDTPGPVYTPTHPKTSAPVSPPVTRRGTSLGRSRGPLVQAAAGQRSKLTLPPGRARLSGSASTTRSWPWVVAAGQLQFSCGKCPWCAGLRAGQEQEKWSIKKRCWVHRSAKCTQPWEE